MYRRGGSRGADLDAPVGRRAPGLPGALPGTAQRFQLGGLKVAAGESIRVDSALTLANGGDKDPVPANDVATTPTSPLMAAACRPATYWRRFPRTGRSMVLVDAGREVGILRVGDGVRLDAAAFGQPAAGPADNDTLAYPTRMDYLQRRRPEPGTGQSARVVRAALLADGKRLGGRGGDIALHASAGLAQASDGQLQLGGIEWSRHEWRRHAVAAGGKVRIGGGDLGEAACNWPKISSSRASPATGWSVAPD